MHVVYMWFFYINLFFYILGRQIYAREAGSNKQQASKSCALSLVRQLFHLGVIEAFSGTLKKNKDVEDLPPYDVALPPEIVNQVSDTLKAMDYYPVDVSAVGSSKNYFKDTVTSIYRLHFLKFSNFYFT